MARDNQKLTKVRQTIWLIIVVLVLVSSSGNIINQIFSVIRAKSENLALENKITELKNREAYLITGIKVATSTAYVNQEIHDKLGLGSINDYRIIMPINHDFTDLYQKVNVGDEIPYWKQWWNWIIKP